jgi:hypothetical protein
MNMPSTCIELKLWVSDEPKLFDIAQAYYNNVKQQAELAEEAILDAELASANAQRIALSTREKASRLRSQADKLALQLQSLSTE